jgi:hypothetical protein
MMIGGRWMMLSPGPRARTLHTSRLRGPHGSGTEHHLHYPTRTQRRHDHVRKRSTDGGGLLVRRDVWLWNVKLVWSVELWKEVWRGEKGVGNGRRDQAPAIGLGSPTTAVSSGRHADLPILRPTIAATTVGYPDSAILIGSAALLFYCHTCHIHRDGPPSLSIWT